MKLQLHKPSVLQLQLNCLQENLAARVTMTLETAMSSSMTLTVRSGLGPRSVQAVAVPLLAPETDSEHITLHHGVRTNGQGKLQ